MDEDVQALVFIVYFVANILVLYHVHQSRLLEDVDWYVHVAVSALRSAGAMAATASPASSISVAVMARSSIGSMN